MSLVKAAKRQGIPQEDNCAKPWNTSYDAAVHKANIYFLRLKILLLGDSLVL